MMVGNRTASTTVRLSLANAVGFSSVATMTPFWVGGATEYFGLPVWGGPVIATVQLGCAALLNFLTPWLFKDRSKRTICIAAATVALLGNLFALAPNLALFIVGCAISGAGIGVLLNMTNRLATEMKSTERIYAVFEIANVLFAMLIFLTVPRFVTLFGFHVVFVVLAVSCLVALLDFAWLSYKRPAPVAVQTAIRDRPNAAIVAALVGFVLLFIGENSVYTFFVPLAQMVSIDMGFVGRIMAGGLIASLFGSVLARLLADKLGIMAPTLGATTVLAVNLIMVTNTGNAMVFAAGLIIYSISIVFITPYAFALLARIDNTGRTASIGPAFLIVGMAVAPSIGASATASLGMHSIGWIAAASILLATALFAFAGLRAKPS